MENTKNSEIKICVIDNTESFYMLENSWVSIAAGMQNKDYYLSFQWFSAFISSVHKFPGKLDILKVSNRNSVVAIIPCFTS